MKLLHDGCQHDLCFGGRLRIAASESAFFLSFLSFSSCFILSSLHFFLPLLMIIHHKALSVEELGLGLGLELGVGSEIGFRAMARNRDRVKIMSRYLLVAISLRGFPVLSPRVSIMSDTPSNTSSKMFSWMMPFLFQ